MFGHFPESFRGGIWSLIRAIRNLTIANFEIAGVKVTT